MSSFPNRMQKHWSVMRPFIKREWPRLTEGDLDTIDGRYDRLVTTLHQVYHTEAPIMLEASVRDKIQRQLNLLEEV